MDLEKGMEIGNELLNEKGLNHSAFTREILGKQDINYADKNKTKELYTTIFDGLKQENGEEIYKDGHDYFLKQEKASNDNSEDCEPLKARITELESENTQIRGKNIRLEGLVDSLKDRIANVKEDKSKISQTWKYNWKTGEAKVFDMDKISELSVDWKEGPKPK